MAVARVLRGAENSTTSAGITTTPQHTGPLTAVPHVAPDHSLSSSVEEAARLGAQAVFRIMPHVVIQKVIGQLRRQERIVFMLVDGEHTLLDIAHLLHYSELDVARILAQLLKSGYIECVQAEKEPAELRVARELARLLGGERIEEG